MAHISLRHINAEVVLAVIACIAVRYNISSQSPHPTVGYHFCEPDIKLDEQQGTREREKRKKRKKKKRLN